MFNNTLKLALSLSLVISVTTNVFFYELTQKPAIATVDVGAITAQFIKEEARKHLSNDEKKTAIHTFSQRLENALTILSRSKSLVLLPREAVIKGGHDYTNELIAMMKEAAQS